MKSVSRRMRSDWNRRARSDALYYVALGRPSQSPEAFLRGGEDLVRGLEKELRRIPNFPDASQARRALEIGCGPGRLMLPLSRHFSEIQGVDVSEEMVWLARRNLAGVGHAQVRAVDGTDLAQFAGESFDFVYSYAVFQHIPSREVVLNYLKETRRVLRTGGIARLQFNGLAEGVRKYDTWRGVRFTADEIARFAQDHHLQLLALEGAGTPYMWSTFAKPPEGWSEALRRAAAEAPRISIRKITDASASAPAVPAHGRHAAFALWVEGLPSNADLNTLRVNVGGRESSLTYIGMPQIDGLVQVTGNLPEGLTTGIQPVHLIWANAPCPCESFLRVIPPGPEAPRIVAVTDSVFAGAERIISSNRVRVHLEGTDRPEDLCGSVDRRTARRAALVCTAPGIPRFEIDFKLPAGCSVGPKQLECRLGPRFLGTFEIVVAPERFWWRRRLHPAELYQAARRGLWAWQEKRLRNSPGSGYLGS